MTHLDDEGRARMVDVADKPVTRRVCVARGEVMGILGTYRMGFRPDGTGTRVELEVDLAGQRLTASAGAVTESFSFDLSPFDKALVEAGGWVEFADARY